MTGVQRTGDGGPKRHSPAQLCHIVFYTRQFDAMVAWYCDVLGAYPVMRNDHIAFLTYDEEHHRVAIVRKDGLADRPADCTGFAHAAFGYGSLSTLAATYVRLKQRGIAPVWEINHGPTTSLYYEDPDRNRIELQVDNFDRLDKLNDWFATGAFDRNPIGVEIKFDDIVERLRGGEPERNILRPLQT
ncbi:MAG: VOC family protein [Xanthobacteraceae bacterium]